MKLQELLLSESKNTDQYAASISNDIKKMFNVDVDTKKNQDESVTISINSSFASHTEHGSNPHVLTPQNLSKVLKPYWDEFRSNGWTFTQPVGGKFTIAVK